MSLRIHLWIAEPEDSGHDESANLLLRGVKRMVSPVGIEPTTNWLKANCSTTELRARPAGAQHTNGVPTCQPRPNVCYCARANIRPCENASLALPEVAPPLSRDRSRSQLRERPCRDRRAAWV